MPQISWYILYVEYHDILLMIYIQNKAAFERYVVTLINSWANIIKKNPGNKIVHTYATKRNDKCIGY